MNDCPRRYTQKKAAYRSVSPFLCQNPAPAGFLLSEPVTWMNNCPRRPKERGLSVSYRYLTTLGFCSVGIVESCT